MQDCAGCKQNFSELRKAVFIDRMLMCSKTAEEHVEHVKLVMDILRQNSVLIKMSKCSWGQTELPYLGHIVSKDGINVDTKRMQLLLTGLSLLISMRCHNLLASSELTNFFHMYVQGYTNLPLTVLLKKNTPFDWNTACQNAFAGLKTALTSAPCLALPNTSEGNPMLDQVCDASGFGLGAVLIQAYLLSFKH